jgi:transcriptional regulator with XRE-family HTH domain
MKIKDILSMNLRYYRKIYNLSQEKFAEVLGTSLAHLNKIEQKKVDVKLSTIEKYTNNLNKYDKNKKIESNDLLIYHKDRETNYSRIDEKK